MQKMRIRTVYCRPRTTVIDAAKYKYPYLLRNMVIDRPNQVWAIDITYIPMNKGYMYLTAIIDLKSRYITGWSLSNTMEAEWVVDTLRKAVAKHGNPEIINSDQGSQFTSDAYINYVNGLKTTKISMDGKGRALDNVFIERFWRTIKYDKLYLLDLATGTDVHRACQEFIAYYNHRRGHSSLHMKTPQSVYQAAA
jgi:putative transposase